MASVAALILREKPGRSHWTTINSLIVEDRQEYLHASQQRELHRLLYQTFLSLSESDLKEIKLSRGQYLSKTVVGDAFNLYFSATHLTKRCLINSYI